MLGKIAKRVENIKKISQVFATPAVYKPRYINKGKMKKKKLEKWKRRVKHHKKKQDGGIKRGREGGGWE